MHKKPERNRKSKRLKGYDYSTSGYYYVTICVKDRFHLFGSIENEKMILNNFGKMARGEWLKTEKLRDNVELDEFVIMPNHVHGIIKLIDIERGRGTARRAPTKEKFGQPTKNTIPTIMRSFKSAVTKQINKINSQPGDKIWQRNYNDRIIRNQRELSNIRKYIVLNPKNWQDDESNDNE